VYSGAIGKSIVASSWHGHDFVRAYVKPRDAHSPLQEEERQIYREAVRTWNSLCDRQKELYRRFAEKMSGYNLFVQRFIDNVRAGRNPEVPVLLSYRTVDGAPILGGDLVIRARSRTLFADGLDDGKGVIALTHADAPYTFVLRKGAHEETVRTIDDLLETDIPTSLESSALDIRLVLTVPTPEQTSRRQP